MRQRVQALVAFHGVRGGVALGKGVPGEAFHLAPDLFDEHRVAPTVRQPLVEGVDGTANSSATGTSTLMPRHNIRLLVEPGEVVGHLDDVLLVYHDPVRFWHQFEEDGVGVVAPFGVPVPLDVGAHHAAA